MGARLTYHRATFDVLGQEPRLSAQAAAAIEEAGAALPGALREWCALANDDEPFRERLLPRAEIVANLAVVLALPGHPAGALRVGPGRGDAVTRTWRGPNRFSVLRDAGDDPPVYEDAPGGRRLLNHGPYSDRFSTFVFAAAWRHRTARYFWSSQDHWAGGVTARDPAFGPMELDFLKENFAEGLADATDPSGPTWYFFTADAWVRLRREGDLRGRGTAYWAICAASRERLAEVLRLVWPCGGLRQALFCPTREGSAFLGRIREEMGGK